MTKIQLLREVLARAGDPQAASSTFKNLAWSLFIETAYEAHPSLSLVESRYLLNIASLTLSCDSNGVGSYLVPWETYSEVDSVAMLHEGIYYTSEQLTPEAYNNMISNPFLSPCSSSIDCYHYYDGKYLRIITGRAGEDVDIQLRAYPDLRDILADLTESEIESGTSKVPLHNATIHKLIPVTVQKLKQEIGLII